MIKEEIIDRLINLDIVDVVSDYVDLKKCGANYKACCPMHKEKVPSFYVSPSKNIAHCFSCGRGGNPIQFIMDMEGVAFPEACKILGKKYNIPIEDEHYQKSDADIQMEQKRESAYIIMDHLQKYFIKNLYEDTPEAKAALSYANSRWGEREVKERGIGYANKDWQGIITFAKKEGLSIELMEEMNLIRKSDKGNLYGFYNDRLMIPVRDKYSRIRTYTARTLDEHNQAKYINGADSFYYHKGDILFGLNIAQKQGAKEELFYIVEGAPDVIRMQELGVANTIAPLGTALTKEQLNLLKHFHCKLCFIPDADEPGIKAVLKNGRIAMENGYRVEVKEIPPAKDGKKQDADSFFKNKRQIEELKSEDFVIWFARHKYNDNQTDLAKSDSIREIADTLILDEDQYTQEAMLEALATEYGHKGLWKNAINDAKRRKQEARAKATSKRTGIDLRKYGFYEEHNCYWGNTEKGNIQWSNFKMKPLFHIMGVDDSKRIFEITNEDGITRTLELNAEELVSMPKFMMKVESVGDFLWQATSVELMKLKKYLYDVTGTAIQIKQYGWQKKGFWAFGNGCIYDNDWFPADHMGIVHLHDADKKMDNYYLQGSSDIYSGETGYFSFERQFIMPSEQSSISFHDFSKMMADVFGNNAKVSIAYLLASIYRDVITSYTTNFPLLNLFGPKGSGKTELGITLMRFFTIGDQPINLRNATAPALSQVLAMSKDGMVHLDEYKNTLDMRIIEIIKGAYDGTGRSRMDMDHGKQIEKTPVDCGVIVSGQEMPTLDIAMFSRMIFLTHDSTVHDRDAKDKFNRMADVRKLGLQHLTKEVLSHRQKFENEFYETYNEVTNEIYDEIDGEQIEDRLWRNWVILLTTYKILHKVLDIPFTYEDMKKITVAGIKRQNSEVISNNELGNLWNAMNYLFEEGMIFSDSDFKVKHVKILKTDKIKEGREYKTEHPILMLRLNHFIGQYKKMSRQQGDTVMSKDSIRYYLTTSGAYLGMKASERWKVYQDGQPVQERKDMGNGQFKIVERGMFDRCMCFDYQVLQEKFDLNLESVSNDEANIREEAEHEKEVKEMKEKMEPDLFRKNQDECPF
ncbi:MAG: DNA primase [Prevotella sp.]|jgi:DNA primase catalytic core|nr:DNA primase [Prevotella sp.]MCH3994131.1 DNA primase [Prevotella sp.]